MDKDDKTTLRFMTASMILMGLAIKGDYGEPKHQVSHALDIADELAKQIADTTK